jgi:hypothetical protein
MVAVRGLPPRAPHGTSPATLTGLFFWRERSVAPRTLGGQLRSSLQSRFQRLKVVFQQFHDEGFVVRSTPTIAVDAAERFPRMLLERLSSAIIGLQRIDLAVAGHVHPIQAILAPCAIAYAAGESPSRKTQKRLQI